MIKISIDMPNDCMECPCCTCDESGKEYWCQALSNYELDNDFLYFLDRGKEGRDVNCPIIIESEEEE